MIGVLCIHGLMGSPREFDPLVQQLTQAGILAKAMTLPSHGPDPAVPIGALTAELLLDHCLQALGQLSQECDQVFVMGHSLGGLCALLTASTQPRRLAGVVSLSAPFEHVFTINRQWDWLSFPVPALLNGLRYVPECSTGFERPNYKPWMLPILAQEAHCILANLQRGVGRIQVPVALAHSRYDLTVPFVEMSKIATHLVASPRVSTLVLEHCGHQIFPSSREHPRVIQHILQFLSRQESHATLSWGFSQTP
jgi:esterase/lipase